MMLTIILPVYNAEQYLQNCLDSICAQSYTNFELIIINDGSKDNSHAICKKYVEKDERIIYIKQKNEGVAMARNKGLKLAKGTYIGFVDADDSIENNMFQNLIRPTTDQKLDVVLAHYKVCTKNTYSIPKTNIPCERHLDENQIKNNILKSYYTGNDPIVPALWNKVYNRNFLEKNKHFFHNQKAVRASDYWFNFDVFQTAQSAYVIKDADYNYNNEITGSIINTFRENQFEGFLATQKKLLEANKEFKFVIDEPKFYEQFFNNTNQFILTAIGAKGYGKAYPLVRSILKNKEFISSFQYLKFEKKHIKMIIFFIRKNMFSISYLIYGFWFLKFRKYQNR